MQYVAVEKDDGSNFAFEYGDMTMLHYRSQDILAATGPTPWRPPLKDLLLTVLGTHPSLWWGIHTTPPRASDERRSHATHIFQHMLAAKELMNFADSAFHPRCYHREMQKDEGR